MCTSTTLILVLFGIHACRVAYERGWPTPVAQLHGALHMVVEGWDQLTCSVDETSCNRQFVQS